MDRRTVLKTAAGFCAAITLARAAAQPVQLSQLVSPKITNNSLTHAAEPFSEARLMSLAEELSRLPFTPPGITLPEELKNLDYDLFRSIGYESEREVWRGEDVEFGLQFFHAGYLYLQPVKIHLVENGLSREFTYSPDLFRFGDKISRPDRNSNTGFSGFRIHTPFHRADKRDEFALFQGASYFRARATGQEYGISARGLALNTAQPPGEEFPLFRSFWVEKPKSRETVITVWGLLDGASVTGLYKFMITNQTSTVMDIEATLFPKTTLPYAGLAPLTSMFRHGPSEYRYFDDYRPRVYDSEGLSIWNGKGERIWRPLINPKQIQFSVFSDDSPKGFGLIFRTRNFRDFQDLQVRYDLRPSLWVEPLNKWGAGSVDLIEFPTETEYADNIVAFWHPAEPLQAKERYNYKYRLHWCWDAPVRNDVAVITHTKVAKASKPGQHSCHLDIHAPAGFRFCGEFGEVCPTKENLVLTSSHGEIGDVYFAPNNAIGGYRLSFDFYTKDVPLTDLKCTLVSQDRPISEIWTYRWTA
jgi:glucans biosynthesis protein